jgi:hypothetical protein
MTFTSPFSTSISLSYCEATNDFMSDLGQSRHFRRRPTTSGLPLETDILRAGRHVSKLPEAEIMQTEPAVNKGGAPANSRNVAELGGRRLVAQYHYFRRILSIVFPCASSSTSLSK